MMYLIILVLLVVFFMTIGFRLIINASIWISGINKDGGSITNSKDDDRSFLLAPEFYNIPDATNSATLAVSGRGTEDTKLIIYVNDEEAEEIDMEADEFEARLKLDQGENTIYAETIDKKNKKAKDSETYTVYVLTEDPSLSIKSPIDGDTRDQSDVTVIGETDEGVSIRINNSPVVVGSDGSFQKKLQLREGDNTITIRAIDIAGNETELELKVRYEKED